jgi:hypothetical protein
MNRTGTTSAIGLAAWAAAWTGTFLAPVHALSRYATADGREDLANPLVRAWADPAADLLRPLLAWSDPDTVYITYGKVWFPVFLAVTVCAFAVRRSRRPTGVERWGWRIALVGYVLATASTFGDYWTPGWMDQSFLFVGIPGVLISLIGSTVLGTALVRRGFRPRATGWLLSAWIPLFFGLSTVVAMGAAALPMIWAWGLAGRALRRPVGSTAPMRVTRASAL